MLLKLERGFDKFANVIGTITAIAMVLMILNVFYDVIMRYFFRSGSIAMQEMEWHLFSVIILIGISYTLKEDGHVRVDLVYDKLSPRKKAFINMFGSIFFILPISLLVGLSSIDTVVESFSMMEQSGDPGGLPYRWVVKSLIPLCFLLLIITTIGFFIKNLNVFRGVSEEFSNYNLKEDMHNVQCELNEHKFHVIDIDEKDESNKDGNK